MKYLLGLFALAALTGCSNFEKSSATFICLNGADLVVTYDESLGQAILLFPGGRSETLSRMDPANPGFYSAPGVSWSLTGFRAARLDDGLQSFGCDEVG